MLTQSHPLHSICVTVDMVEKLSSIIFSEMKVEERDSHIRAMCNDVGEVVFSRKSEETDSGH